MLRTMLRYVHLQVLLARAYWFMRCCGQAMQQLLEETGADGFNGDTMVALPG
jgi:hypothetical protein